MMTINEIIEDYRKTPLDSLLLVMLRRQSAMKIRTWLRSATGKAYSNATKETCVSAAYEVIKAAR